MAKKVSICLKSGTSSGPGLGCSLLGTWPPIVLAMVAFPALSLAPSLAIWYLRIMRAWCWHRLSSPAALGVEGKNCALEAALGKEVLQQSYDLWGTEIDRVLRGLCRSPTELTQSLPRVLPKGPPNVLLPESKMLG